MTRDEAEQIAKITGAMLIYDPHGGPVRAQDLDIVEYAAFIEHVVRDKIYKAILDLPEGGQDIQDIFNIVKGK